MLYYQHTQAVTTQVRKNNIVEMAQWVKVLAAQPEFNSQDPQLIPPACLLTMTVHRGVCIHPLLICPPQIKVKKLFKVLSASGRTQALSSSLSCTLSLNSHCFDNQKISFACFGILYCIKFKAVLIRASRSHSFCDIPSQR